MMGLTWLFLSKDRSTFDLFFGLVLSFGILYVFRSVLSTQAYVRRVVNFFRWLLIFVREFILSNLHVAWIILTRKHDKIEPHWIELDVSDMRFEEMIILSQTITLTPGTCSTELDDKNGRLLVHILDARDPQDVARSIRNNLKQPLLDFTRHG